MRTRSTYLGWKLRASALVPLVALCFLFAGCGKLLVSKRPANPADLSFYPSSSATGELIEVTTTSRQFSGVTAVSVGGTSQVIVSISEKKVVFLLSAGTSSGKVSLTLPEGVLTSDSSLTLLASAAPSPVETSSKTVASGAIGLPALGLGVTLSANGSTLLVGGWRDNANVGAGFVYTRTGSGWTQQAKLVASDSVGTAMQGISAALSADGNTAILGMRGDNGNIGAAAIFVRDTAGSWSQQGAKLVASDGTGTPQAGVQVAISADGNTALVGGWADNANVGAAWVYKRSAGVWQQDGPKLVGTGQVGAGVFGSMVALNDAGDRALVSAYGDNGNAGATFVFQRSGGVWSQMGAKLVGTGGSATAAQGTALSFDYSGRTALIGGYNDAAGVGAFWIFSEDAGTWSQVGAKIVGTGAVGTSFQGISGVISSDGNTIAIGGYGDSASVGAVWIFARAAGVWSQVGAKLTGTGTTGAASFGRSLSLSRNGRVLVVGAPADTATTGAFWTYDL